MTDLGPVSGAACRQYPLSKNWMLAFTAILIWLSDNFMVQN
jgi:hypothetical protein